MYDVAVIGASLAGSTLASLLGKHGFSVVLFDSASFPRSKACGEGLSTQAVSALSELGIIRSLHDLPHFPINGYEICPLKGKSILLSASHSNVGVQRLYLDHEVLANACSYDSVDVYVNEPVLSIDGSNKTITSENRRIQARFIVNASGANSRILKSTTELNKGKCARFGFSVHIKGENNHKLSSVRIILTDKGELFLTPISHNLINASFLGYADRNSGSNKRYILKEVIPRALEHLGWNGRISDENYGVSLPLLRNAPVSQSSVINIGDACEQLDPIGGMGMTHAVLSAVSAARSITNCMRQFEYRDKFLKKYIRDREAIVSPLRAFTALVYHSLASGSRFPTLQHVVRSKLAQRVSTAVHQPFGSRSIEKTALSFIGGYL